MAGSFKFARWNKTKCCNAENVQVVRRGVDKKTATSEKRIIRIMGNEYKEGETNQMDERWTFMALKHQYKKGEINYDLIPCARCFAQLILSDNN